MTVVVADRSSPLRRALEGCVRACFLAAYGARVHRFPDRLVGILGPDGRPLAVAGLRLDADGLFSEAYLDREAAEAVSAALGRPIERRRIVEISGLAASRPGAALPLVAAAVAAGHALGAEAGLFTVTARLRALLRRAGLAAADLGPASRDRVADPASWGSYYLHDPRVMAVHVGSLPPLLTPIVCEEELRLA